MGKYQAFPIQVYYCTYCFEKTGSYIYHNNPNKICPVCYSGENRQECAVKNDDGSNVESILSDHPIALEMLYQTRMRILRTATDYAPLSTIEDMIGKLTEIKLFYSDEHPEPNGFRSGLILDKMKELNEVKNLLRVNLNPEDRVEISDGPIY